AVPLVAIALFQAALRTVTVEPDCVTEPFHSWVTVCPAEKAKTSDHPLIGSPRFVTSTAAPKPPGHWLEIVYFTWQPAAAGSWPAVRAAPRVSAVVATARIAALRRSMGSSRRTRDVGGDLD